MNQQVLEKLGFKFSRSSTHTRRTIMLEELELLLDAVPNASDKSEYFLAINEQNCLRKRTQKSREYTGDYLVELYTLDPKIAIFRTLLFFWNRDVEARPLLALFCSITRDSLLRSSTKRILESPEGAIVNRLTMEEFIDSLEPNRYSTITLASVAKNLNSSWTQSGHLKGRASKQRVRTNPTPASVGYALYLGYLQGTRGTELFETELIKLMDCSKERAIELAESASAKGWIVFKRIGNVIEVLFPNFISAEEGNWLRE